MATILRTPLPLKSTSSFLVHKEISQIQGASPSTSHSTSYFSICSLCRHQCRDKKTPARRFSKFTGLPGIPYLSLSLLASGLTSTLHRSRQAASNQVAQVCFGGSSGSGGSHKGGGGGDDNDSPQNQPDDKEPYSKFLQYALTVLIAAGASTVIASGVASALDVTIPSDHQGTIFEIQGQAVKKLSLNGDNWEVLPALEVGNSSGDVVEAVTKKFKQWLLPEGFPRSVSEDYLEYSFWRAGQIICTQINGVLCTQAMLYAVGLGKGAIPTAAAVSWVLKDGIGYLSKIGFSRFGRHFDVHPKEWRLFCDFLEDISHGLELLTPFFPKQFLYLGAAASALRSSAGMAQAATRNTFYSSFSVHRNFAEIVAKGEAQGMFAKAIGMGLGVLVAAPAGRSKSLLAGLFTVVATLHMLCNLRSYQAVQLRSLNSDRAALVVSEFLVSGEVPSVYAVNAEDTIFRVAPDFKEKGQPVSPEAKQHARAVVSSLDMGVPLTSVASTKELESLDDLYKDEKYILIERAGRFKVLLREGAKQRDMFRALTQAVVMEHEAASSIDASKERSELSSCYKRMRSLFSGLEGDVLRKGWQGELVARPGISRLLDPTSRKLLPLTPS